MHHKRIRPGSTWRVIGGCGVVVAILLSADVSAACAPPPYKMVSRSSDSNGVLLYISLASEHFSVSNLLCLAAAIQEGQAGSHLVALIFDSETAAEQFSPSFIEVDAESIAISRRLRASYVLDASTNAHYLDILPLGFSRDRRYNTRITLPVAAPPHCQFELKSRCFLAFGDMDDAEDVPPSELVGTVVLTGSVGKNGRTSSVRVVTATSTPIGRVEWLKRAALANLDTWWFEPAHRADAFTVTYTFGSAGSPAGDDAADIRLDLPNRVTVTVRARK